MSPPNELAMPLVAPPLLLVQPAVRDCASTGPAALAPCPQPPLLLDTLLPPPLCPRLLRRSSDPSAMSSFGRRFTLVRPVLPLPVLVVGPDSADCHTALVADMLICPARLRCPG